jgi:aspartate kinase
MSNWRVYKFGGASVRSADGVRNLKNIIEREHRSLFIVVSAMGKTTNALERCVETFTQGKVFDTLAIFNETVSYHRTIMQDLFDGHIPECVEKLFSEVSYIISSENGHSNTYEYWYDRIVSYGELISTAIVSEYLKISGIDNKWLDMRRYLLTTDRHRDADIDMELSIPLLKRAVYGGGVFVGQGFIGADKHGDTTTLGREGSDYSAAAIAYILDADNVTIWKDVDGILNADPKIFKDAVFIPELSYLDAIELAYSGAQIIHPKTIKPLQNKNIPLFVRPFGNISKPGSIIHDAPTKIVDIPVLIIKHNQVLVSIQPSDLSFVLEDRFTSIFSLLEHYGAKINMIQSSAVSLSICIDATRHLDDILRALRKDDYHVRYNTEMELLTIRGYDNAIYKKYAEGDDIYLMQKTRKIVRLVRRVANDG